MIVESRSQLVKCQHLGLENSDLKASVFYDLEVRQNTISLSPELPSLPLMRIINVDYFTNQLMYTVGQICLYFIFFHFFFCFTLLFLNVEAVTGQPDVFQGFQEYIIKLLRHLFQMTNCASRFPRDRFSA